MPYSDLTFTQLDTYLLQQPEGQIIHQIWFGTIPNRLQARLAYQQPLLRSCRVSWDVHNPRMCHVIWNREHCFQLVRQYYAEYEELFRRFSYEIQRCDFVRYCLLHRYGGVYADMDYKCCKPLAQVFTEWNAHDIYLVESPNGPGDSLYVSNSFMMSRRREHKFWKALMSEINVSNRQTSLLSLLSRHFEIMYTTGPGILTRLYHVYRFRYKLQSLPHALFHPLSLHKKSLTPDERQRAYTIHYGFGSWESLDSKILIELWTNYGILLWCLVVLILPQVLWS
jgi:mannosyltransferase OCH1-like enzyme